MLSGRAYNSPITRRYSIIQIIKEYWYHNPKKIDSERKTMNPSII